MSLKLILEFVLTLRDSVCSTPSVAVVLQDYLQFSFRALSCKYEIIGGVVYDE